jgi:hypothetical protein
MGQVCSSKSITINTVNIECPVCKKIKNIPNLVGTYFIISEIECKCNHCNTFFPIKWIK